MRWYFVRSDFINIIGKRYGRWTVLEYAGKNKHGQDTWLCRCDCGTERVVRGLGGIRSKSCGCLQRETAKSLSWVNKTHGDYGTSLYRVWAAMKRRCNNHNVREFKWYGGRGISYCDEWEQYETFKKWAIDSGYKPHLTLDRDNTNGDYEPSNCRWVSMKEQQHNRRNNIWVETNEGPMIIADLARKTGISDKILYQRYHEGARTVEELTTSKERVINIEYEDQFYTLKEIAERHSLKSKTVWMRYKRGARSYEDLSKGVQ